MPKHRHWFTPLLITNFLGLAKPFFNHFLVGNLAYYSKLSYFLTNQKALPQTTETPVLFRLPIGNLQTFHGTSNGNNMLYINI